MGLREYKPTSPGRRNTIVPDFRDITKGSPEKSLLAPLRKRGGRNNKGRLTVRHQGSGHKQRYRIVDFSREKSGPAQVMAIEYDPNRTARIALVRYDDGTKRYIVAPDGLAVGATIHSGEGAEVATGNAKQIGSMPTGTRVHNIEFTPGKGGQMAKSAGAAAQIMAHEGGYTLVRLPSGEMRRVRSECMATVGQVGNLDHQNIKLGKAGRARHLGQRPEVRGKVMSPRDHPHGGGEGRNPIGMPGPKTPWGKPARGYRTRNNQRTDKLILRRRYQR